MGSIRLTISFDEEIPAEAHSAALSALAGALRSSLKEHQQLTRTGALTLPGGGPIDAAPPGDDRIFKLVMPDGDLPGEFLRVFGGWLMQWAQVSVAIRAEGPGGGTSLRLKGWSAVAFAGAAAQIHQRLNPPG